MIVRRCFKASSIVPGGGAVEMELSKQLRQYSKTVSGKEQLVINSFAKALEVIPKTIADNAGLDSIEVMNKLRHRHCTCLSYSANPEGKEYGVDINGESGVCNTYESFVWEPVLVKTNAFNAATEAACTILSIDETVRNPKAEQEQQQRRMKKMAPKLGGLKNTKMR
jgi:T-complex protein 1 subunit eta